MVRFLQSLKILASDVDYINSYHAQKVKLNKERIELVEYIAREIEPRLERKEIYFDESQINKCIR